MPYQFGYIVNGTRRFSCTLKRGRCQHRTKRGRPCRRTQYMGFDACHQHIESKQAMRVAPSTIQGAGKGVFAVLVGDKRADERADDKRTIVFKKNQRIMEYKGERVNSKELDVRYGDSTAPYALLLNHKRGAVIDAACKRGIAAFVNHRVNANARFYVHKGVGYAKAIKDIYNGDEIFMNYGRDYILVEQGVAHYTRYTRKRPRK